MLYHIMSLTPIQQVALRGLTFAYLRQQVTELLGKKDVNPALAAYEIDKLVVSVDKVTTQLITEVKPSSTPIFIYHSKSTAEFVEACVNCYEKTPHWVASEDERSALDRCFESLKLLSQQSLLHTYTEEEIKAEAGR